MDLLAVRLSMYNRLLTVPNHILWTDRIVKQLSQICNVLYSKPTSMLKQSINITTTTPGIDLMINSHNNTNMKKILTSMKAFNVAGGMPSHNESVAQAQDCLYRKLHLEWKQNPAFDLILEDNWYFLKRPQEQKLSPTLSQEEINDWNRMINTNNLPADTTILLRPSIYERFEDMPEGLLLWLYGQDGDVYKLSAMEKTRLDILLHGFQAI